LLALLAIPDHALETLVNLGRQQILQRAAIAVGECQHDHLVGAARAAEEMSWIERGILGGDGIEPLRQRLAGLSQPLPAVGRRRHIGGRHRRRLVDDRARQRNHFTVRGPLHDVARRAIIRRSLASGALSEDVTQAKEDEDRQGQEDDGINIHVAFAFWFSRRQRARR
jgi:hypothetical protein